MMIKKVNNRSLNNNNTKKSRVQLKITQDEKQHLKMISHIKAPAVSGSLCAQQTRSKLKNSFTAGIKNTHKSWRTQNKKEHYEGEPTKGTETLCTHRITTDQEIGERRAEAEL